MKKILFISLATFFTCDSFAQAAKIFKWAPWKSVSGSTKEGLKKIIEYGNRTAYDDIIEKIEDGCTIQISVLDMDGDGKMEYAIETDGGTCCGGNAGCEISVYKDGGKKQIHFGDHNHKKVKPAKNGVISSTGVLIKFQTIN